MNFFKRKVRRGTTLTISDQTKQSRGSLSSGDGRASSVGSTSTLRKNTAEEDRISDIADVKENGSFQGSVKLTRGIKQTRFSDDANGNNNSSVVHDVSALNRNDGTYLGIDHPENGQPMALLGHRGPNLVEDLPLENASSGTPMALYASVIKGDKAELKKIITGNPKLLDTADNFGRTPLMYCVLAERLDCAKYLINMGCSLDQVDNAGRSATHSAAHKGSYKFIELLHNRGASLDIKDNDGQTPLHLATRIRTPKCVEFILRNLGPGMVDIPDNQMRTALHWSAAFNNTECVKLLIKYGINIALTDAECKTPLHWAANNHDPSTVNTMAALLEKSPSVLNWQNNEGRTALHFAVAHGNSAAVEFLVNFSAEEFSELFECDSDRSDYTYRTPMHWAAQLGHTHIVKLLLQGNANISSSDGNGATPFLYAALTDKDTVIEAMIEHDPKVVDQADIEGRTALMWAAGKGSNNAMRILLGIVKAPETEDKDAENSTGVVEREAKSRLNFTPVDVDKHDNKGNTALHVAARNGHGSSVELLLKHGARHDLQNTDMHHTPVFGACEKGHLNCVTYLLDYKASIDLIDSENRTPLHWAALGGHAEVCELLIKEGLDVDVRDKLERTPLHCAAFGGFINCMNLLLEHGANVDLQDQEGRSALHWAAQSGHLDAIKLLFQYSVFPNSMEYTEERLTPLDHALQKEKEDVMHYLIEQGALSAEHIRNIAAMRIQAYFRGFKVRRQRKILMKTLLLRKEKREKIEAEMEKSAEQVRNAAASKIQECYRRYHARKGERSIEEEEKSNGQNHDVKDNHNEEDSTDTELNEKIDPKINNDSGSHSPEQELLPEIVSNYAIEIQPNAEAGNVSHDEGVICDHGSIESSHSSLPNNTKTTEHVEQVTKEDEVVEHREEEKQGENRDSGDASELELKKKSQPSEISDNTLTEVTDDRMPSLKPSLLSNSDKKMKRYKSRKTRSKAATRPLVVDSDSSKDVSVRKRVSSISSTSSLLSTTTVSSTVQKEPRKVTIASTATNAKFKPKPPSQPKKKKTIRKRLIQVKSSTSSGEVLYPELDNIGNEYNIESQNVKGIAYRSQLGNSTDFNDELNLIPESPVQTSSSLDLSEYIESLMSLSPQERKLLIEHQNQRREAFRVANQAATTIQKAWLKHVKEHHPTLHQKFKAGRKREAKRKKLARFEKSNVFNTPTLPQVEKADKTKNISRDHQTDDAVPNEIENTTATSGNIAQSIASSSAASMSQSARYEALRSSLICSSESGSVSTGRKSSKTRRSKISRQNNMYISLERLEDLSRIYGNPKLVRDLLANTERSNSSLPSITSTKSTASDRRPVTVPETPRKIFESSLKGTSAYSQPKSAMHSPRVWTALPGVQKQTRLAAAPSLRGSPKSKSMPANQNVDYRMMPLQWQKLYGELQDANAAETKRKHATRFSYNLGEIG